MSQTQNGEKRAAQLLTACDREGNRQLSISASFQRTRYNFKRGHLNIFKSPWFSIDLQEPHMLLSYANWTFIYIDMIAPS